MGIGSLETRSGSEFDASNTGNHAYICNYERFLCYLNEAVVGGPYPTPTMPWSTMSMWVFDVSLRGSSCRPGEKRGSLRRTKSILSVVGFRSRCKALSQFGLGEFLSRWKVVKSLMGLNVLKCGLGVANRRYWSGSSGNNCIMDLIQGLEPRLESRDESKGRR